MSQCKSCMVRARPSKIVVFGLSAFISQAQQNCDLYNSSLCVHRRPDATAAVELRVEYEEMS